MSIRDLAYTTLPSLGPPPWPNPGFNLGLGTCLPGPPRLQDGGSSNPRENRRHREFCSVGCIDGGRQQLDEAQEGRSSNPTDGNATHGLEYGIGACRQRFHQDEWVAVPT